MSNREKILEILGKSGPICDDCLSQEAKISNRVATNQICNDLVKSGLAVREQSICPGEHKRKLVTRLIVDAHPQIDQEKDTSMADGQNDDLAKQKWYWEGKIQGKIVDFLQSRKYDIRQVANTATKEPGVDIVAQDAQNVQHLVSVKGFPFENNKHKNTQARHWFAEALFDLILYRQDYPEATFALGMPDGFPTYDRLRKRIDWFKQTLPFIIYWVNSDGDVRID